MDCNAFLIASAAHLPCCGKLDGTAARASFRFCHRCSNFPEFHVGRASFFVRATRWTFT